MTENNEPILGKGIVQQVEEAERGITIHTDQVGHEDLQKALRQEVVDAEVIEPTQAHVDDALGNMPTNIPYELILNDEGIVANPIKKGNPYLNPFMNRRDKKAMIRKATRHPKNNKKGVRLIVTPFAKGKFLKTFIEKQFIASGTAGVVSPNGNHISFPPTKEKVLTHNRVKL